MKTHGYFDREDFCSITAPTIYSAIRLGIIDVKLSETRRMKEYSNMNIKQKVLLQHLKFLIVLKIDLMR